MKKITRTVAVAGALTIALSGAVACGEKEYVDNTKVNIYVQAYDGGYGINWLQAVEKRFEAEYATYKTGDKTGVDIHLVPTRDTGMTIDETFAANTNDIFFTENCYYSELYAHGRMLDVTDVLTAKLPNENVSVVDKMSKKFQDYYGIQQEDGKQHYYGVRHASGYYGLLYDEELFYRTGLFYTKAYDDGETSTAKKFTKPVTEKNANGKYAELVSEGENKYYKTAQGDFLSHGPDGKYGTDDDGQSATYDDFFALCDYMVEEKNVTPFLWAGNGTTSYLKYLTTQLIADYEGAEQLQVHYDHAGTAKNLISVSDDGVVTKLPDLEMSTEKRAELGKSAGYYYAAKFIERMFSVDGYRSERCSKISTDHLTAQQAFMSNKQAADEKCAFFIDGVWWQNEAGATFDSLVNKFGDAYKKENRSFKYLSLPKATEDKVGEPSTLYGQNANLAFIRSDIASEKKELAKLFLQYNFTDVSNREFTTITNIPRPLAYTLSETERNSLTTFGKSVLDREDTVFYGVSNNPYFMANQRYMGTVLIATIGNMQYTNETVFELFMGESVSATAEEVFRGVYKYMLEN